MELAHIIHPSRMGKYKLRIERLPENWRDTIFEDEYIGNYGIPF